MREVRVRNEQEALKVVEKGMEARQVWGTRMNEKSSRSHAVFTVKVVRIHGGAPDVRLLCPWLISLA
jgi:kinesin family protein 20